MLTRAIDRVSSEFPALRVGLLTTERGLAQVSPTRIEVDVHRRSPASLTDSGLGRIVTEQVLAGRCKADLLHFFDLTGPVFAPSRPFVTTLHDASIAHGFGSPRDRYKHLL